MDISNVGDVTIWEFSGQESYFPIYHHFLWPSPYILTLILFNLEDSPSIQVQQVCFWLNFLLARQPANLPSCNICFSIIKLSISFYFLADYGQIMLIATHVDQTRAIKTQQGEWISADAHKTLETVRKLMGHVPNLMSNVIVMDSNVPASYAFKQLKSTLTSLKQDCIQVSCFLLEKYDSLDLFSL